MNSADNPLILLAAVIVGIVARQVLAWLEQSDKKVAPI